MTDFEGVLGYQVRTMKEGIAQDVEILIPAALEESEGCKETRVPSQGKGKS